ncbi:MAG: hypothetical protein LBV38_02215 [Alistipes sp.]|jgi:hypothetical protein|nr:hypothetical protein [Alistipes sp.]
MKRSLLISIALPMLFITLFSVASTRAQVVPPPLPMMVPESEFAVGSLMSANQRGFYMNDAHISIKEAKKYARPYRYAMRHIRRGQGWNVGAMILGGIGGGLIGFDVGNAIARGEFSGAGVVAGVIFAGAGFGMELLSISQYRKAAAEYNSHAGIAALPRREATLSLAATDAGMGLQLSF